MVYQTLTTQRGWEPSSCPLMGTFVAFIFWAFYTKDDLKSSTEGVAARVLTGKGGKGEDGVKETELVD